MRMFDKSLILTVLAATSSWACDGNVSIGRKDDDNFRTMVEVAVKHQKPVRIGVNWGSLDQALLTRMMDENSKLAEPILSEPVRSGNSTQELTRLATKLVPPIGTM